MIDHDPRLRKLARVLAHYSLNIKDGNTVWLMGEMGGLPLYQMLFEELLQAGAHVYPTLQPPLWEEIFLRYASDEQLARCCPFQLHNIEICDKRIRV